MCNEILKLKELLEKEGIPFEIAGTMDGYQIGYPVLPNNSDDICICSVIEFPGSYGYEDDRLEIMGLLNDDEAKYDSVSGHLTAEDVFGRIKKNYDERYEKIEEARQHD